MSAHKLKITAPGWDNFTGEFCQVNFVDGISESVLPRTILDRVAGIVQCELLDTDGNGVGQAGITARIVGGAAVPMVVAKLEVMTEDEQAAERKDALARALRNPVSQIYTEGQLEQIASTEGLKGLREISDPWGVRERSITKLIGLILGAQNDYLANAKDRDADAARNRKAATEDALAKQAAREAEIDAQARILKPDNTPNAIAADGRAVYVDPLTVPQPFGTVKLTDLPTNEWASFEAPVAQEKAE